MILLKCFIIFGEKMFLADIKNVGMLKDAIKNVPDNFELIFSVDPTDQKTKEKDFGNRYQSDIVHEMSVQNGRLIFHLYDMDKNF